MSITELAIRYIMNHEDIHTYAATITPNAAYAALEKPYPITEWYLKLFVDSAK